MPPIIALDFATADQAVAFVAQFPAASPLFVKVGMEVYYAAGPAIIRQLQAQRPLQIFLDLKLHDIPNTVEKAAAQIGRLGVAITTVHAAGGSRMIAAAKAGLRAGAEAAGVKPPRLLAITHLTSSSQAMLTNELSVAVPLPDAVQHLAAVAQAAGADGVVASAQEVPLIRAVTGPDFLIVTPGIRPANAAKGDQVRVVTPGQAAALGASAIVVGRPITQAADPLAAYNQINQEWSQA
ncbi:orotidine-5'-phosphate decarboxylase [Lacticaseibacillus parakribbianus]|uniref:orotidine-5'-phosphate decarboxylase n=1 Tax=Lacticaseibacillus parakribbianus TaxID=2970927 RepID=UPI0021CB255A|nr:orotidine-5'-phosphate decarboxylase [Lacticaseibacillus parakribbianus]